MFWEHHHYRFGLAGEGQADIIQRYLEQIQGRVLYIGCGPWIEPLRNLLPYCSSLIAADKEPLSIELLTKSRLCPSLHLCRTDANQLSLKGESLDFILALGLFVWIREPETVFQEFYDACRKGGYAMITNSIAHPIEQSIAAAERSGFRLVQQEIGYCPNASGDDKRRYLLVFTK
jgi:SAM-dependent methyltransferase